MIKKLFFFLLLVIVFSCKAYDKVCWECHVVTITKIPISSQDLVVIFCDMLQEEIDAIIELNKSESPDGNIVHDMYCSLH